MADLRKGDYLDHSKSLLDHADLNVYPLDHDLLAGDIAKNTGDTAKNTSKSNEELSYLRDIAEREAINRFTTAEIRVKRHDGCR